MRMWMAFVGVVSVACASSDHAAGGADGSRVRPDGGTGGASGSPGMRDASNDRYAIPPSREAATNRPDAVTNGPDISLVDGAPLPSTPLFAFKSNYAVDEQLWVFGASGAAGDLSLAHVSAWPRDARLDCAGRAWSSGGYPEGSGRFGTMLFDHTGKYLVVRETLAEFCPDGPTTRDERLVAYRIANATLTELFHGVAGSLPLVTAGATVGVQSANGDTVPPFFSGAFDVVDGSATPIALSRTSAPVKPSWPWLVHFSGKPLLVVPGFAPVERGAGGFTPSHVLDGVSGDIAYIAGSADDTRLCVVADSADAAATTSTGYILGGAQPVSFPVERWSTCSFAPGGEAVFFTGYRVTDVYDPTGAALGHYDGVSFYGASGDAAWGSRGATVVRWPFASRKLEVVFDAGPVATCNVSGTFAGVVGVYLAPGDGKTVLVKVSCGCTDCDDSATFVLRTDTLAATLVETHGEHAVFAVASIGSSGLLLTSSIGSSDADRATPAPGSFWTISSTGVVDLRGPFASIARVVHGPATPAWGDAWRNPHMR